MPYAWLDEFVSPAPAPAPAPALARAPAPAPAPLARAPAPAPASVTPSGLYNQAYLNSSMATSASNDAATNFDVILKTYKNIKQAEHFAPLPVNAAPSATFGSAIISSLSNINSYFNIFYDNTNNANVALTTYRNAYQKTTPSFKQYTRDAVGALSNEIPMALSNESAYTTNYASASNAAASFIHMVKNSAVNVDTIRTADSNLNKDYRNAVAAAASASNAYYKLTTLPPSSYTQQALNKYNSAAKAASAIAREVKLADNVAPSQPQGYIPQILHDQGAFQTAMLQVQNALDVASTNRASASVTDSKLQNIITNAKAIGAYAPAAAKEGFACAQLSPLFYAVLVIVALLTVALIVWLAYSMIAARAHNPPGSGSGSGSVSAKSS